MTTSSGNGGSTVMTSIADQHERVRREFARQSGSFAAPDSFFASRDIGAWIAAHLPLSADREVLDLAGGAGHLSRALAARAARFVVVDLTPEQLEAGRRGAAREGVDNVEFVQGDAARTPFADAAFDLVMSRFALHHVPDPAAVVREAGRVCRGGGHLALIDMVAPDDEAAAATLNELERLRDPSHAAAITGAALEELATREGEIVARDGRDQPLPVEPWLDQAGTPKRARQRITEALASELTGGRPTGMRPRATAAGLAVVQRWELLVVRRGESTGGRASRRGLR